MRERFTAAFAIQPSSTLAEDCFAGMASVFNSLVDAWIPTRILPGAFTKTLQENTKRVKVLYQHNPDWPIGIPVKMEETGDGLYVEAKVSKTMMGTEVLTLVRDKVLTELSIGFDPMKFEMVDEGASLGLVRHVKEIRLWEFSPVTFAADSRALISQVHALFGRNGVSSPEMMTFLATTLYKWEGILALNREATPMDFLAFVAKQSKEQHEGKVLSAKNKQLVQEAITALQSLLEAAEPPPAKEDALSLSASALTPRRVDEAMHSLDLLTQLVGSVK